MDENMYLVEIYETEGAMLSEDYPGCQYEQEM